MNSSSSGQFTKRLTEAYTRFRQLPRQSQLVAFAVGVSIILGFLFFVWRSHVRSPEYALRVINGIESHSDIDNCRAYMTPQGLKVITYALDNQNGPSTSPKLQFQKPQIRGTTCYIPFTQGDSRGHLQFLQTDVWQFDDLITTRYKGRDIELSAAYAIDHPFLAALKVASWEEMLSTFIKGLLIGLSLAG